MKVKNTAFGVSFLDFLGNQTEIHGLLFSGLDIWRFSFYRVLIISRFSAFKFMECRIHV